MAHKKAPRPQGPGGVVISGFKPQASRSDAVVEVEITEFKGPVYGQDT